MREAREHEKTSRYERRHRHSAKHRLTHPTQRSLTTNQKMHEQIDRSFVVEQAVEAVAHRVLHGEQAADALHRLRITQYAPPQSRQPGPQVGLGEAQLLISICGCRVNCRSAREHQCHRLEGLVCVLLGTTSHATGIVGDDTANGARNLARWVGAESSSEPREASVDLANGSTGLHAHARTGIEHLNGAKTRSRVDQHLIGHALPRQARATRSEGKRAARP